MVKHTISGNFCELCGRATSRRNRRKIKTQLCGPCKENIDALPEKYFCKGTTSSGKPCRQVTSEDYCFNHKPKEENE
jgi:epoxyqueuosine reductase QueG